MRYIKKNVVEGNKNTARYMRDESTRDGLDKFWNTKNAYVDYCKKEYRDNYLADGVVYPGWRRMLLNEQGSVCCYCMARIDEGDCTIEHIMPQDSIPEDWDIYAKYSEYIKDYVIHAATATDDVEKMIADSDYPHRTAYCNLSASCKGWLENRSHTCNNARGNGEIIPLMHIRDVEKCVTFKPTGEMVIVGVEGNVARTIANLHLNDELLKTVRNIWYLIKKNNVNVEKWRSADDIETRKDFFRLLYPQKDLSELRDNIKKFYTTDKSVSDEYWKYLMKYEWFANVSYKGGDTF
ncbi:MAG: hypothetical protein MJZ27_08880 [Bacteroidales bacterium]|nr:hypothetical protein [Bacteroidales bacterium]